MTTTWNFKILDAAVPEAIEIVIYDIIGKTFFGDGVGASDVIAALQAKPKAKSILVRVSSIGGVLDDAKSMLNLLAERASAGVSVEFRVDSLAASAAAYLLTTPGAKVTVAENAFVMIHKTRSGVRGTESDLAAVAERLRAEDELLVAAFSDASQRRGKSKSAPDYAAAIANNADRYFSAAEAIEWGLADETAAAAVKVAACAVDIAGLTDAPDALRDAPYAQPLAIAEPPAPEPIPAPAPPTPVPTPTGDPSPPSQPAIPENIIMSEPSNATPSVARALGLPAGSTETDIVAAATREHELGLQIMAITGVATSGEALGAIRGQKAMADRAAALEAENVTLKADRDQQAFDALIATGTSAPVKLSPATAKHYAERFAAAKDQGRGAEIVADLKGFLAVAPTIIAQRQQAPAPNHGSAAPLVHNGKAYAELKPLERARLAQSEPDLYRAMKQDHDAAQAS